MGTTKACKAIKGEKLCRALAAIEPWYQPEHRCLELDQKPVIIRFDRAVTELRNVGEFVIEADKLLNSTRVQTREGIIDKFIRKLMRRSDSSFETVDLKRKITNQLEKRKPRKRNKKASSSRATSIPLRHAITRKTSTITLSRRSKAMSGRTETYFSK